MEPSIDLEFAKRALHSTALSGSARSQWASEKSQRKDWTKISTATLYSRLKEQQKSKVCSPSPGKSRSRKTWKRHDNKREQLPSLALQAAKHKTAASTPEFPQWNATPLPPLDDPYASAAQYVNHRMNMMDRGGPKKKQRKVILLADNTLSFGPPSKPRRREARRNVIKDTILYGTKGANDEDTFSIPASERTEIVNFRGLKLRHVSPFFRRSVSRGRKDDRVTSNYAMAERDLEQSKVKVDKQLQAAMDLLPHQFLFEQQPLNPRTTKFLRGVLL